MLESLLRRLQRHRLIILLVAAILFLVAAWQATRLSVNDSPERWFPASIIESWERFEQHYDFSDTVVVGIHFRRDVRDGDLAFLKRFRERLLAMDDIQHVIDVALVAGEVEGVPLTKLVAVPPAGQPDPYAIYRGILFDDPTRHDADRSLNSASSGPLSAHTMLAFVLIDMETEPGLDARAAQQQLDQRRRRVVGGIYQAVDEMGRDDVAFHVGGGIVIQYEMERIARKAMRTILPVALGLMLLALGGAFRSTWALAIAVFGGLWSAVVLLGAVALGGWTLDVITVGAPTLMVVIVIATTMHFAHYYSDPAHLAGSGASSAGSSGTADGHRGPLSDRPAHFVRWVAVPCLGAAITTGVGFLMLAFNELGPARELGVELFFGAVLAFFGALLVWLMVHPFRAAPGRILSSDRLGRFHRRVTARPGITVTAILLVMGVLGYATTRVRIDVDPFAFFHEESRVAKAFHHFAERKFGIYVLDVMLVPRNHPDDPQQLREARQKDAQAVARFEARIKGRPEVRNTISAMDLRARQELLQSQIADQVMGVFDVSARDFTNVAVWLSPSSASAEKSPAPSGDPEAGSGTSPTGRRGQEPPTVLGTLLDSIPWQRARPLVGPARFPLIGLLKGPAGPLAYGMIVGTADLIADRYDALMPDIRRAKAFAEAFRNWTTDRAGTDAIRISFMAYDPGTGFRPLLDEVRDALPRDRFECVYAGPVANVVSLSEGLVGGITWGLVTALLVMALLCAVLFRSLRLMAMAFLPNVLPVLVVFGVMGAAGVPLNSGSAMVTTVALGVALNDTVHFVMHYRRRRLDRVDTDEALHETFAEVGRPIVLTSVINCVGFGVFLLSDFRPMCHFGVLASIAMAAALLGDLILLPNLLKLFDRGEKQPA